MWRNSPVEIFENKKNTWVPDGLVIEKQSGHRVTTAGAEF